MSKTGSGQLLFSFVRHWSRRSTTGGVAPAEQGRLLLVLEAVTSMTDRGQTATVNAVAGEMGIDQSGASRLVKSAVDAGYVEMTTAQSDGRKREVIVMPSGDALLREAHAQQEQVFDELTAGWSQLRREEFHAAMTDLIRRSCRTDVELRESESSGVASSAEHKLGTVASTGDDWLDAAEAAEWVGCSVWTIRRWIRSGKLSAWKRVASGSDGRRAVKSFVRRSDLDEKFRPDNPAEHVNRIRESALPFNDRQKETLRQVSSDHVFEREHSGSEKPREQTVVPQVESSPVDYEARAACIGSQGTRRVGGVAQTQQGRGDA